MRTLVRVLLPAVAGAFYRRYAGWLAGGGLLLGGVLSANEHAILIREALGDVRLLAVAYLLPWALYTLVSTRFAGHLWAQSPYEPLRVLRLVPALPRWGAGLLVQATVLAPCWAYGIVILVFAVRARATVALAVVTTGLLLLTILGWLAHERALSGPRAPLPHGRWGLLRAFWQRPFRNGPAALWGLQARLRGHTFSFLLTKALTVASIGGLCAVYSPDTFEARVLTLGALVTAAFHARLPADLYAWERTYLAFRGNLPLPPAHRWGQQALQFGVLLLPELLAWAAWHPLPPSNRWLDTLEFIAFPWAFLVLTAATLPGWPKRPPEFLGWVLPLLFGVYLLVLAGVPLSGLTAGAIPGSWWLTRRYCWRADDPPVR